jgi:hypothetical protein
MTFAEYRTAVLANVFPDGYSGRVEARYTSWMKDVLIELQKYIPSLQTHHRERIPQDATFFSCGTSAFKAPPGKIQSFHTELLCSDCDKVIAVPYTPRTFRLMLEERRRPKYTNSDGSCNPCYYGDTACLDLRNEPYGYYEVDGIYFPYPELPLGLHYATPHIDLSCRSKERAFALYDGYVWTWPVIQSTEVGILRWHGIKRNWQNSDEIPWKDEEGDDMREIQEIVELFVGWKSKLHDDCDDAGAATMKSLYDGRFAEFMVSQQDLNILPSRSDCFP